MTTEELKTYVDDQNRKVLILMTVVEKQMEEMKSYTVHIADLQRRLEVLERGFL